MMLSLKEEVDNLLPKGWLKDEFSTVSGYIRYYSQLGKISEKDLDDFLTELSSRGIIVRVDRREPWIYIDVIRRFPIKKARSEGLASKQMSGTNPEPPHRFENRTTCLPLTAHHGEQPTSPTISEALSVR